MKKGWQTKKLSEVCEKITDGTHQTPTYFDDGVLFLSSRNVTSGTIDWENVKYIDDKQHGEMQRRVSPRLNDILLAKNGTTGVAAMVDRDVPFDIYVSLALLRPLAAVRPTFLLHFINSPLAKQQFTKRLKGIGVPNLHLEEIREVEIPVPPLAEQQRIVGLLDVAFEGLATAKANAEKNLQNARALFESHLQSVFTQRGPGWVDSTIGAEIKFIDYRGKTPVKTASGVRLITAKNVKMGFLQETPMEFIAAASYKGWMTRGIPKMGDVLFTTEAPLANVAQLDTDEKVAFAQRIIIMQPNAAKLDSTFLKYLLLSQPVQQRIRTKGTGATVQGIKASLLKLIEISFPKSLDTQEQIVSKLDDLRKETQRLARLYERKHAALEALKKSLLHQAFTGALE